MYMGKRSSSCLKSCHHINLGPSYISIVLKSKTCCWNQVRFKLKIDGIIKSLQETTL